MPIHQNLDGTWQWGKSGKKYKKKLNAIKQMKAIFANGYVEKKASYKPYTNILGLIKKADRDIPSLRYKNLGRLVTYPATIENFTKFLTALDFDSPGKLIRTSKLSPLSWDYFLYGAGNKDPRKKEINLAIKARYKHTQQRRAALINQPYKNQLFYPVSLNAIYGTKLPYIRPPKPYSLLGPLSYKVNYTGKGYGEGVNARPHASHSFWYNTALGQLYARRYLGNVAHLIGHSSTITSLPASTETAPKNFELATSGTTGLKDLLTVLALLANRRKAGIKFPQLYWNMKKHPMSHYFNSSPESLTGMHQLMMGAAARGRFFKNWNELLPWMIKQRYIEEDKKTGLLKHVASPSGILNSSGLTGLDYFVRYLNYLRALKAKRREGKITEELLKELLEGRKRLNLISLVADNRQQNSHGRWV